MLGHKRMSRSGGIFSKIVNSAGGDIWTSVGTIKQRDFVGLVSDRVHGTGRGRMFADASLWEDDAVRFANVPGVNIHYLPL